MGDKDKLYIHVIVLFPMICGLLACPNMVTRNDWHAFQGRAKSLEVDPATHVVIHHSRTPKCMTMENCVALVKSIQGIHMNNKRYGDIGYNFLIGEDGNIYEGVGWHNAGTHDKRLNSRSIGICFLGDFTSWSPNDAALDALQRLLECGVDGGVLDANYRLITHSQLTPTDCPGRKLYTHIRTYKHWVNAP